MVSAEKAGPTILTIFGAGGDLTWRKLMPAIYNLFLDGWAPGHFAIIGLDLKDLSNEEFRKHLHEGVNRFSRRGKAKSEKWKKFERHKLSTN